MTKKHHKKYIPFYLAMGIVCLYTIIHQFIIGKRSAMIAMNDFMGIRFVLFGALKLLDIKGFVETFMQYDILARKRKGYAYLFPIIEIALGIAYLADSQMKYWITINGATVIIVGITGIGIRQALKQKKQVECVCMGTKFPLPMSNINFIENVAMGLMAVGMLIWMSMPHSSMPSPSGDTTACHTGTTALLPAGFAK